MSTDTSTTVACGVTAPAGFRAAGVAAGLKSSGAADLALVVNDGPLDVAAAVFTANRVAAAPVQWSRVAVSDGRARAIVLNSGGANACTGPEGFADTHRTAEHVGEVLEVSAGDVLVCSTGLIGVRLDMPALLAGVAHAASELSSEGGPQAAQAILTTDTVPKETTVTRTGTTATGAAGTWRIGVMAKGAGMLAPALATMLVVITTDAVVDAATADAALRRATAVTLDRLDSDGCMSTNDTVALLASGASEVRVGLDELAEALTEALATIGRALLADAEGASHDIAITVRGATGEHAALAVARAVSRSNLVKTAVFGNDPNWGRILAQAGTVPVEVAPFDADAVDVAINGVQVCRAGGVGVDRSEVDLASSREVSIDIDLHAGDADPVTVWTNDLTHDYVHENSAYSS